MKTLSTATVGTTTSRNATRLSQRRGASRDATLWGEEMRGSVLVLWRLLARRGADSSVFMWDFVTSLCVLQHCQNILTTDGAIFIAAEDNHMQRHLYNHLWALLWILRWAIWRKKEEEDICGEFFMCNCSGVFYQSHTMYRNIHGRGVCRKRLYNSVSRNLKLLYLLTKWRCQCHPHIEVTLQWKWLTTRAGT